MVEIMEQLQVQIRNYLQYCTYTKRLAALTVYAYEIDLAQFQNFLQEHNPEIQSAEQITK